MNSFNNIDYKDIRIKPIKENNDTVNKYYFFNEALSMSVTLSGKDYIKWLKRTKKIDQLLNPCPITEALEEMEWQEKLKQEENEN